MSINAPSGRSEFSELGKFYEEELAPLMRKQERARREAISQALAIGGVGLVACLLIVLLPGDPGNIPFFVFVVVLVVAAWRIQAVRKTISGTVLGRICEWLGLKYVQKIARPEYCADFRRLTLLPSFDDDHWEDEIRGRRGEADFVVSEAHLKMEDDDDDSSRTVFHGQVLVVDYHREFLGETIVKRDLGVFNRFGKPGRNFQRVGMVSERFEKAFEAWSTDQVEARYLLDPAVLERFEELDRLFSGSKLRAAFSQGKLFVAIETGDKLSVGTMFQTMDTPQRVEQILREFDIIFDLVDIVAKRIDSPTGDRFSVEAVRAN